MSIVSTLTAAVEQCNVWPIMLHDDISTLTDPSHVPHIQVQ